MQHHFVPFLKLCSQTLLLRLANLNVCVHLFAMQLCVLYFFVSFPLSVSFYVLYFLGKYSLFTKTWQQ